MVELNYYSNKLIFNLNKIILNSKLIQSMLFKVITLGRMETYNIKPCDNNNWIYIFTKGCIIRRTYIINERVITLTVITSSNFNCIIVLKLLNWISFVELLNNYLTFIVPFGLSHILVGYPSNCFKSINIWKCCNYIIVKWV